MITLGAFIGLCQSIETSLGPVVSEIVGFIGVAAFTWWRARKLIDKEVGKATAKADAGIAAAHERVSNAKAEVRAVNLQLAEIKGSLRPAPSSLSVMPPTIGTSTSQSGNFEPVVMPELGAGTPKPRPSMPDPTLTGDAPLPRPSNVPKFDRDTPAETPGAKARL